MSHELMQRNGKTAMFCVGDRESAWHKLGQRTPDAVKWEEAMKLADLAWKVVKKPLYARNPLGKVVEVPVMGTFRTDDGAFLGSVGEGYGLVQNIDMFAHVDSFLEEMDGAHYESAGALGAGERIWCLARIPEADYIVDGGDEHKAYVLCCNAHDGTMSFTMKLVDERVVCRNTLTMALAEQGASFKLRHSVNIEARMAEARRTMQIVKREAVGLKQKMLALADRKMSRESVVSILDRLFPKPKDENAKTTRRDNTLAQVLELYEANDENAYPSVKGTGYNLLNAITEYADHFRTSRGNGSKPGQVSVARAESALFGSGEKLKAQAVNVILEETGGLTLDSVIDATLSR